MSILLVTVAIIALAVYVFVSQLINFHVATLPCLPIFRAILDCPIFGGLESEDNST